MSELFLLGAFLIANVHDLHYANQSATYFKHNFSTYLEVEFAFLSWEVKHEVTPYPLYL